MLRVVLAWLALTCAASAQISGGINSQPGVGPLPSSCSQATVYLAALPDAPSPQVQAIFTEAICGLQADGNLRLLDALYFHSNATAADARINVVNPSAFAITTHGSCPFTVNQGFTGDAASCYQDPGVNLSTFGGKLTLNSATLGVCILNSRATAAYAAYGAIATDLNYLFPFFTGSIAAAALNDVTGGTPASTSNQGTWFLGRISSVGFSVYFNDTNIGNELATSTALPNTGMIEMALNTNGVISSYTGDTHAYWFFGAGMNGVQLFQVYNRLHIMEAALGNTQC